MRHTLRSVTSSCWRWQSRRLERVSGSKPLVPVLRHRRRTHDRRRGPSLPPHPRPLPPGEGAAADSLRPLQTLRSSGSADSRSPSPGGRGRGGGGRDAGWPQALRTIPESSNSTSPPAEPKACNLSQPQQPSRKGAKPKPFDEPARSTRGRVAAAPSSRVSPLRPNLASLRLRCSIAETCPNL